MKRIITVITLFALIAVSANAMSYSRARSEALYLTDKMAYELNLTDDQYNAAYEINLDYLMCMNVSGDIFGIYWTRRNTELSYVLTPAQYSVFLATEYFYRPISWVNNRFYFGIYSRYPRNKFFRPAPRVYATYRGGNRLYEHSPYNGRMYNNRGVNPTPRPEPRVGNPTMSGHTARKQGEANARNMQMGGGNSRMRGNSSRQNSSPRR